MPLPISSDAVRRRLLGIQDSRGAIGQFSRGSNVYNGGLPQATSGPLFRTAPVGRPTTGPTPPAAPPAMPLPNQTPENIPWGQLPFDQYYEANIRRLQGEEAGLGSEEEIARRRLQESFSQGQEGLGMGRAESLKQLAQSLADRGLIHSGINIGEQGEIGQDFLRGTSELEGGRARGLEDLIREMTQRRQGITGEKTALDEQRARDAAAMRLEEARKQAASQAAQQFAAQFTTSPTGQIVPAQSPVAGPSGPPIPSSIIQRRLLSPRR